MLFLDLRRYGYVVGWIFRPRMVKNNRTAWEALSLNRLLSGSVFRRALPHFPTKLE